jgi:hypothetical protein
MAGRGKTTGNIESFERTHIPRIARTRSTGAVANSDFVLRELPTSSGCGQETRVTRLLV